ncbi:hypothetical protein C8F01DRAFT_1329984 [Mycena amicta]|nr:hypothetical protein C8F01DRAFT_1329984 [Mycena amicta]
MAVTFESSYTGCHGYIFNHAVLFALTPSIMPPISSSAMSSRSSLSNVAAHQAPYPQHRLPDLDKCEAIVPSDVLPVYIHDNRADGRGGASHLFVLVAFKNRSSESASEARVMVIVSPHSEVVNWDDGKATARNVRVSVEAWATSWGKTFGSEHGASGDNLKGNEGRKASEDGELHLVDNVETEY